MLYPDTLNMDARRRTTSSKRSTQDLDAAEAGKAPGPVQASEPSETVRHRRRLSQVLGSCIAAADSSSPGASLCCIGPSMRTHRRMDTGGSMAFQCWPFCQEILTCRHSAWS